ncbi:hypothetical protein [Ottowia sp.]|uniref:hypothetical protein n=1 Tax=Ottowia sp. TaxID=1898956 RepID=UPI00261F5B07|nr:hypothetical protein [Ottowia sp.]
MDAEQAGGPAGHAGNAAADTGRFEGREAFREAVRNALRAAAEEGWREIVLSDASFLDWPLGEPAVIDSLQAWARGGRHLLLLARQYDDLQRVHPRFVNWRRTWSHLVDCRACRDADPLELPSAIWSPRWMLHRIDPFHSRGVAGADAARRAALRELLDDWLAKAVTAFPATTLGL